MQVVWDNGGDGPNPDNAFTTLGVHVWNAGNNWRIPADIFDDTEWRQLHLVGGLHLEHDDGTTVPLPTTRPEAAP